MNADIDPGEWACIATRTAISCDSGDVSRVETAELLVAGSRHLLVEAMGRWHAEHEVTLDDLPSWARRDEDGRVAVVFGLMMQVSSLEKATKAEILATPAMAERQARREEERLDAERAAVELQRRDRIRHETTEMETYRRVAARLAEQEGSREA